METSLSNDDGNGNENVTRIYLYCDLHMETSLSNDDGNGNENVTRKYIFISFLLLRDYFNLLNFAKMANYPGTKLVGVEHKLRRKIKNSPPCVHVLHKTLNVVISRCCFGGRQRNVPKCKTHVQSDCFCSLNPLFCGVVVAVAVVIA